MAHLPRLATDLTLLERLHRIALALRPLRLIALLLGYLSGGLFIAAIFSVAGVDDDRYLIPALIGAAWGFSLYGFITGFRSIPDPPDPAAGWLDRNSALLSRGVYWMLALGMAATSLGVLALTLRLILLWSAEYV